MDLKEITAKVENTPVPEVKKVALAFSGGRAASPRVQNPKDVEDLRRMLLSAE